MTKSFTLLQLLSLSDVNSELLCTCKNDSPEVAQVKKYVTYWTNNKNQAHSGFKNKNTYAWIVLHIVTLSNAFCFHNKEHFCSFSCLPIKHLSPLFKVLRHSTRRKIIFKQKNPTPKETNKAKHTHTGECKSQRHELAKSL